MAQQQQVLEGTWEEIQRHAAELKLNGRHVKLIVSDELVEKKPQGQMMTFGMFPQLQTLTDEDFKAAEFHGDPDDGLDWS
jgi:hypothetical protein